MPKNSWGIIYCPKEGTHKTHKRWNKIKQHLNTQGIAYDFVQSEGPGSIERLSSMMTRVGYNTIIVVGGDSALNHALCGIMSTNSPTGKHPALGVIPNGYVNDFAQYWSYNSNDYKQTIGFLQRRRIRKIDIGKVILHDKEKNEVPPIYFLNCVNIGLVSAITNIKKKTKSFFGLHTLSYLFSALILLFQRTNFKFKFSMSGEKVEKKAMSICIGNAHAYGQTPSAVPYNGLLDITLVSKPQIFQLFQGLWLLFTGRFLSHRGISVWRTNHAHFHDIGHALVSIDGRTIKQSIEKLEISIIPEEIDFLIP